jgi:hypothetical protein
MNKKSDDTVEFYIDHETRIRILENLATDTNRKLDRVDERFDKLNSKIETMFIALVSIIVASFLIPVILHAFKLV